MKQMQTTQFQESGERALKISRNVRYFPIIFVQGLLLLTVLVFAFGPWEWPVTNPFEVYTFLLMSQLALLLGYVHAVRKRSPVPFRIPFRPEQITWACTIATLMMLVPTALVRTAGNIDVVRALTNPGEAYNATRFAL